MYLYIFPFSCLNILIFVLDHMYHAEHGFYGTLTLLLDIANQDNCKCLTMVQACMCSIYDSGIREDIFFFFLEASGKVLSFLLSGVIYNVTHQIRSQPHGGTDSIKDRVNRKKHVFNNISKPLSQTNPET